MPTIIDGGAEREVSEAELSRLRQAVFTDQRETLYWDASVQAGKTKLWDVIDEKQTSAFPDFQVAPYYLKKVVFRCSACTYTSAFEEYIKAHADNTRLRAKDHVEAKVLMGQRADNLAYEECSACGTRYERGRYRLQKHIDQVVDLGVPHQGRVSSQLVRRYTIEPSAPVILFERVVAEPVSVNGHAPQVSGPEASQVERRLHRRHRRRGRGHKERVTT